MQIFEKVNLTLFWLHLDRGVREIEVRIIIINQELSIQDVSKISAT